MRLYLLQYGLSDDGTPVPGYLIVTDDQQHILVDTGFPAAFIGQEPMPGFHVKPEDYVTQQLARLDLTPDDIDLVVCSHFDFDHAGANELFTSAELIVQRQHDSCARSGETDRFESIRAHWDAPGLRYRLIDGDTEIAPGVELIETSGHVPGHQSVLVRLSETGPVLLAIDALHRDPAIPYQPQPFDMDPAATAASIEKIKALVAKEGVTMIFFGHSGAQWATVRQAPDYYA
jgi:N-acyl homoserine lactone hydrolase